MDAAVLNLQVMADVNGNNKLVDAELEVKKLQELVRKLERQNEQLRSRANAAASHCSPGVHLLSGPSLQNAGLFHTGNYQISAQTEPLPPGLGPPDERLAYFHPQCSGDAQNNSHNSPTALEELELLQLPSLISIEPESDYSWLYVSPKEKLYPQSPLSPLQWCRHVLDNPSPDVELAKRSLCYRIDQAKRWRGVLSSYTSSVAYSPIDGQSSLNPSVKCLTKPALTEPTAPSSPSSHCLLQQPLAGRGCAGLAERSPSFLYHTATHNYTRPQAAVSPQSSTDNEFSTSELDDDSISMGYKLQDMTDVQVMARLQEESLRQEFATTSATGARRSSSFSLHSGLRRPGRGRSEAQLQEDDEEEEEECDMLPPPQPRLLRTGSMQRSLSHSHSLSSPRDPRRSPSSPQYLSSMSNHNQPLCSPSPSSTGHTAASTDKLRRSMPNLLRAPSMLSVPSVTAVVSPASHTAFPSYSNSSSTLRNSQSFDSSSGLARLQSAIPSSGQLQQRVQSIGNFSSTTRQPLKATAYVSPTIQGSTTMPSSVSLNSLCSSGIPLPSKLSTPSSTNRSALPRPASFIGSSGTPRSKIAQPGRSLLAPPKSVAALSALRDTSWKDGCY